MIKYIYVFLFLIAGFLFFNSCTDPIIGNKSIANPETYLSVFSMPSDTLAPGKTVKKISWWGDSPNGIIVGFKISFDSLNWGYTTKNDSTFIFTINGQDSLFRIWVASVDDKGNVDPTPANNLYPVVNSPPSIVFDPQVTLPDTIFPIATVKWIGTDPDGENSIQRYWFSFNDTLHFRPLPGTLSVMTLTRDSGLVGGNTCLYMKAQDRAQAYSNTVRLPQDSTKYFYVKNQTSKILLIKDMPLNEMSIANTYFTQVMDTIHYDVLDIKSNNGNLIPKIINPMFIETLKLFKIVMWIGNRNGGGFPENDPNLNLAQNSLPYYLNAGGKVFWASGFPNVSIVQGSLFNFAPIDSVRTNCFIPLILFNDTTFFKYDPPYPKLFLNNSILIAGTKGFYPSPGTKPIYQIFPRSNCNNDTITVAIKSPVNNPILIFMLMPIYYLNGNTSASNIFMKQVLINEFGYGSANDYSRKNLRKLF